MTRTTICVRTPRTVVVLINVCIIIVLNCTVSTVISMDFETSESHCFFGVLLYFRENVEFALVIG